METGEHKSLGNGLRFSDWDDLKNNPHVHFDDKGIISVDVQGISITGLPVSLQLTLTAGEIGALSGDYFGGSEVDLKLPLFSDFNNNPEIYYQYQSLGELLVKKVITPGEEEKFINSYRRLANPGVTRDDIDTIFTINETKYIRFSSTLNSYAQQIAFAIWVKNYSEILTRNLSHFTPWSVRAYILGHFIALKYAKIHHELKQLLSDPEYKSDNDDFNMLLAVLKDTPKDLSKENLQDLCYRYQALALSMEFFSFHYYTDHFAAGHGAKMGDLRALLPERFGLLGSILVNDLHDELNRVTVITKKAYDPTPNNGDPAIIAGGDGDFDEPNNHHNREACMEGMGHSLEDLRRVFQGGSVPQQAQYGGLEHMPDVDDNYRQHQPLILLGQDNKIYYRTQLSKIEILSPSDFKTTYAAPAQHGYTELTSKFQALLLVAKLRLLPFIYEGTVQPFTAEQLSRIEAEELELNPAKPAIPRTPFIPGTEPTTEPVQIPNWRTASSSSTVMDGLHRNSILRTSSNSISNPDVHEQDLALQI